MRSVNNRVLKDDNGLKDKLQHLGLFKTSENLNSFGGLPLLPHLNLPKGGGGLGKELWNVGLGSGLSSCFLTPSEKDLSGSNL